MLTLIGSEKIVSDMAAAQTIEIAGCFGPRQISWDTNLGTPVLSTKSARTLHGHLPRQGLIEHKFYCSDPDLGFSVLYLIDEVSGGPKTWVELIEVRVQ